MDPRVMIGSHIAEGKIAWAQAATRARLSADVPNGTRFPDVSSLRIRTWDPVFAVVSTQFDRGLVAEPAELLRQCGHLFMSPKPSIVQMHPVFRP